MRKQAQQRKVTAVKNRSRGGTEEQFVLEDAIAGYYICPHSVAPIAHQEVPIPLEALLERPVELRLLSSLIPLRDAVIKSSLGFSIIRLRNARTPE